MSTLFIVNDPGRLHATATTAALVLTEAERGPTFVASCSDLAASGGSFMAWARPVEASGRVGVPRIVTHVELTRILPRANPVSQSVPWAWEHGLTCLRHAERLGIPVNNSPETLARFAAKPGLLRLSSRVRPPTLLTTRAAAAKDAIARFGRSVVKPAQGSQGSGVFIVDSETDNLSATLDLLVRSGPVVVQPWLPAAVDGDVRVFLADGDVFTVDGRVAAIRRRPAPGELRSNIHLGGEPEPVDLDGEMMELARRTAGELRSHGVRFAGIDCIGDRIVEVNVCAPGGLHDMSDRYEVDFVGGWLDALLVPLDC